MILILKGTFGRPIQEISWNNQSFWDYYPEAGCDWADGWTNWVYGGDSTPFTCTFDLTISAVQLLDAYCSMEDNLCYGDFDKKVLDIGDVPSSEVKEANSENTFFTFEIKVENE